MTEAVKQLRWLPAVAEAAKEQGIPLPPFAGRGMGNAQTARGEDGRLATFKRRLVPEEQAAIDGVEWTLWGEEAGVLTPVAAFRVPAQPSAEGIAAVLGLLRGWLVEKWPVETARAAVRKHPGARPEDAGAAPLDSRPLPAE